MCIIDTVHSRGMLSSPRDFSVDGWTLEGAPGYLNGMG